MVQRTPQALAFAVPRSASLAFSCFRVGNSQTTSIQWDLGIGFGGGTRRGDSHTSQACPELVLSGLRAKDPRQTTSFPFQPPSGWCLPAGPRSGQSGVYWLPVPVPGASYSRTRPSLSSVVSLDSLPPFLLPTYLHILSKTHLNNPTPHRHRGNSILSSLLQQRRNVVSSHLVSPSTIA